MKYNFRFCAFAERTVQKKLFRSFIVLYEGAAFVRGGTLFLYLLL